MRAFPRAPLATPACRVDPGQRNCRDKGGCGGSPARPYDTEGPLSCWNDATVEGAACPPGALRCEADTDTGSAQPMILPKVRDPRFVTIRRGGTLSYSDHHLLAL